MICPKIAECIILEAPVKDILSFSACLSLLESPENAPEDFENW